MLKILLVCTSGISTTLLIKKIEEAAKKKHILTFVWAVSETQMDSEISKSDIVLLGPQSRFLKERAMQSVSTQPVIEIDLMAYGTMDGEAVFEAVMEYFKLEL